MSEYILKGAKDERDRTSIVVFSTGKKAVKGVKISLTKGEIGEYPQFDFEKVSDSGHVKFEEEEKLAFGGLVDNNFTVVRDDDGVETPINNKGIKGVK